MDNGLKSDSAHRRLSFITTYETICMATRHATVCAESLKRRSFLLSLNSECNEMFGIVWDSLECGIGDKTSSSTIPRPLGPGGKVRDDFDQDD